MSTKKTNAKKPAWLDAVPPDPTPAPAPAPVVEMTKKMQKKMQMQRRNDELVVVKSGHARSGSRKLVIVIPTELDNLLRARVVGSHSTAIAALAQHALETSATGFDITLA